jgi:hypothetical protein
MEFFIKKGMQINAKGFTNFSSVHDECNMIFKADVACPLSNISIIRISGADASDFLQSQFSNDISLLTESLSQINSYCNPKGRVISVFRMIKLENEYFLLLRKELSGKVIKRLTMYKLNANVDIDDCTNEYYLLGLILQKNTDTHTELTLPEDYNAACTNKDLTSIKICNSSEKFLLFFKHEHVDIFWDKFIKHFPLVGTSAWELSNIYYGSADVFEETSEHFVPQMLNMDVTGGVSFTKGCYPGQEIVARLHYLGNPNKRMYMINIPSEQTFTPGTKLFREDNDQESCGEIVSAQQLSSSKSAALAVIRTRDISERIIVKSQDNSIITVKDLPYKL